MILVIKPQTNRQYYHGFFYRVGVLWFKYFRGSAIALPLLLRLRSLTIKTPRIPKQVESNHSGSRDWHQWQDCASFLQSQISLAAIPYTHSLVRTDSLFYQLFQTLPAIVFKLIGNPSPRARIYSFLSQEVKQTSFRIDGILVPPPYATDTKLRSTVIRKLCAKISEIASLRSQ